MPDAVRKSGYSLLYKEGDKRPKVTIFSSKNTPFGSFTSLHTLVAGRGS